MKPSEYQGMTIEELLKACVRTIHIDPASVADMQDVLAHESDDRLAEAAKTDKVVFMKIVGVAWSIERQWGFYNKHLTPWIQKYEDREDELVKVIRERDAEINILTLERQKIRNAVMVLKEI